MQRREEKKKKGTSPPPPPPCLHVQRHTPRHSFVLYTQQRLGALVRVEADGGQGGDLDVSDGEADEEAGEAALLEDDAGRLGDAQAAAVADGPADLHAAPDDLEGVRDGLGDGAREAAGGELGPGAQRRGLVGRRVGGLRERGVLAQQRGPEHVAHGVVRQERDARVRDHAQHGGREAAVEIHDAGARRCGCGCGRRRRDGRIIGSGQRVFVVDLLADVEQRGAPDAGLEGQPHADHFQRVREEDGGQAGQRAGREPAEPCLLVPRADHERAVLLVCDELDGGVGVDLEESGRMAPE